MKEHEPYTASDWKRDMALSRPLPCPDCGSDQLYRPRRAPKDRAERRYRACKMCGFWQEADGTPAYRCWLSTHHCTSGPAGKYLRPGEDGYSCPDCHRSIGRDSAKPWPNRGSG